MPSPNIVQDIHVLIQNKLVPAAFKKWQPQLRFGLRAYSLQAFQSATGNARRVVANANTAARKSERLLANEKLAGQLGRLFDTLSLVKPSSFVAVDHSDMNGLMALVGAVQTRNGRAIPCFVETTYSDRLFARADAPPRKKALRAARARERKECGLTDYTVQSLQVFADRLGFWPKLVFDRWFGGESLVRYLVEHGATFYVRLKSERYVELTENNKVIRARLSVKDLKQKDAIVQLCGMTLRVIRSPKDGKNDEPWFILTNDFTSSRGRIVKGILPSL